MRACLLLCIAVALLGFGCGRDTTASLEDHTIHRDPVRGVEVRVPTGWAVSPVVLTPGLAGPREVLAMGTGPLPVTTGTDVHHLPVDAVEAMSPDGAFLSVQEYPGSDLADEDGTGCGTMKDRPAPPWFPETANVSMMSPDKGVSSWWIAFRDGDRCLQLLAATGPGVTAARRAELEDVAGSLRFASGRAHGLGPWIRTPVDWTVTSMVSGRLRSLRISSPDAQAPQWRLTLEHSGMRPGAPTVIEDTVNLSFTPADLAEAATTEREAAIADGEMLIARLTVLAPIPEESRQPLINQINDALATLRLPDG